MMKNRRNWLGILAMVLVFGMLAVSCEEENEDEDDVTRISIWGINDKTGTAYILLYSTFDEDGVVAGGKGTITNNQLNNIPMQKVGGGAWAGKKGDKYMMFIHFENDNSYYAYTGTLFDFIDLGISSSSDFNSKLPKLEVILGASMHFNNFRSIEGL